MPDFLTDYFDKLTTNFLSTFNSPGDYLDKIVWTALLFIMGMLLRLIFKYLIIRNVSDIKTKYSLHKFVKRSVITLTIFGVLFIWIQAINALVLIALLMGIFFVVMVRGLMNNIIGFYIIKYRKYFKIGHRVEIKGIIGDVIEINLICFKLLEVRNGLSSDANTGRVIKLPNKIIFDESIEMIGVANTFIWHEIKYVLSFDSDWHEAERIMTDVGQLYFQESVIPLLKDINEHLSDENKKSQPVFSLNTNDAGIVLVLRYLVNYKNETSVKTELQRKILNQFEGNQDIKFATLDIRILPN